MKQVQVRHGGRWKTATVLDDYDDAYVVVQLRSGEGLRVRRGELRELAEASHTHSRRDERRYSDDDDYYDRRDDDYHRPVRRRDSMDDERRGSTALRRLGSGWEDELPADDGKSDDARYSDVPAGWHPHSDEDDRYYSDEDRREDEEWRDRRSRGRHSPSDLSSDEGWRDDEDGSGRGHRRRHAERDDRDVEYEEEEEQVADERLVGSRVCVYWKSEDEWFFGAVRDFNSRTRKHLVAYDDGDSRWTSLWKRKWERDAPAASAGGRLRPLHHVSSGMERMPPSLRRKLSSAGASLFASAYGGDGGGAASAPSPALRAEPSADRVPPGRELLDEQLRLLIPGRDVWTYADVIDYDARKQLHLLRFGRTGDAEWLNLAFVKFSVASGRSHDEAARKAALELVGSRIQLRKGDGAGWLDAIVEAYDDRSRLHTVQMVHSAASTDVDLAILEWRSLRSPSHDRRHRRRRRLRF